MCLSETQCPLLHRFEIKVPYFDLKVPYFDLKVLGQTDRMTDRQAKNNIPPLLRRRGHKKPT